MKVFGNFTYRDEPIWIDLMEVEAFGKIDGEMNIRSKSDEMYLVDQDAAEIIKKLEMINVHA